MQKISMLERFLKDHVTLKIEDDEWLNDEWRLKFIFVITGINYILLK